MPAPSPAAHRAARRRNPGPPPAAVRAAYALWITAVAAGVFETALMLSRNPADGAGAGLAVRSAVFTAAVLVAVRMRRGAGWARITLALGLGVLGTASLVVEPLGYLLDGGSLAGALAGADALEWVFGVSRTVHLAAVLTAVALMFAPAANAYFRGPDTSNGPYEANGPYKANGLDARDAP
ncbi:hypothetical protein [Streptomyces sp. NBC_01294]|uniref:hypothetical protein n=1 Tax=Streptomyces sp. NBC_01294 TaxID=2903815 RepID=UPI002DDA9E7E|nr:hypothetical protein [Streptomyces sp. NBC_01294]WRZ56183.1 hypothetical protein OG534_06690 [Streptomyces sp. NBC_01294]